MMPTNEDRAGRMAVLCAGGMRVLRVDYSVPGHPRSVHGDGTMCDHAGGVRIAAAPEGRTFAGIRGDLVRIAAAGQISPLTRMRTERAVRTLAEEAYDLGKAEALTRSAVAGWVGTWLPPEDADEEDWAALRRVAAMLRDAQ